MCNSGALTVVSQASKNMNLLGLNQNITFGYQ